MPSVLPFDIIALIIDTVGENKDINLLKDLALVSHSFLQICSKHLFATVELHPAVPKRRVASSKKGFVKLLKNRPDVVKYIRKLTYKVGDYYRIDLLPPCPSIENDDHLLSPILPNFLRTIPRLNCLTITASNFDWNKLDSSLSSLTSAFLHLMHLPTVNHIDLSNILNFPLSSLTSSVNLHRLDLSLMHCKKYSPEIVVQSEMMPKIRELNVLQSSLMSTRSLNAKRQDGRPAFDVMDLSDLRRLSTTFDRIEDIPSIRYLLQNAKLLEKLHLSVGPRRSLVELHDILSPSARTLKVLDLTIFLYEVYIHISLAGLCEELEAMAGHNMLEALSLEVQVFGNETEHFIGCAIQEVEEVLVKPGWSALRQVSINIPIGGYHIRGVIIEELSQALQSLPNKYLSHLSKLESVAFNYSAYVINPV